MVGQEHRRWFFSEAECSKIQISIENRGSYSTGRLLHGSLFMCNRFALVAINSKLLQGSFPNFCVPPSEVAHCGCAIRFESEQTNKSSIQICCFAQDSIRNMPICSYALCLLRDQWMIKHCTAGRKTGIRGTDLRLGQLNSNKMFKAVLFELNYNDPILFSQILAKCNGQ